MLTTTACRSGWLELIISFRLFTSNAFSLEDISSTTSGSGTGIPYRITSAKCCLIRSRFRGLTSKRLDSKPL